MQAAARLVAAFALVAVTSSFAQEPFPSRPVRLVVPVAAGITPGGDLISPVALGGTMYLLYEGTIFFIRLGATQN